MSYSINGIRNFKIGNLMDYSGDWGVTFNNEEEDWISTDWNSNFVTLVREAIEKYAPNIFGEIDLGQSMNESEAKWIEKSLPNPSNCIEIFNMNSILSKAKAEKHKSYSKLLWLYENWCEGFSIFISY
ncbi:Uncharacterised protein [Lysinibacillus capsici]|uniref:Uncharacterized protein n=1 Tax=Lysinibacillus capsici TaxID=2115968 RepID=A0A2X1BNW2_9BACI|nr:hypothetical protein [Lysinibacillus capsici]SPU37348.1 Uncharacterised protein [Lysinibacillus capsici]